MKIESVNVNKPIETVPYGATVIPENRLKYLAFELSEV